MRRRRIISSRPDSAAGFDIGDLVERIGAYTASEPVEAAATESSAPAPQLEAVPELEREQRSYREYPHPACADTRLVPLYGVLDDATLGLLEHVVSRSDDALRRVAVLEIAQGAVATRRALLELRQAHLVALAAGNRIVMVASEQAVRDAISNLNVPDGPVVAATNERAMEHALEVVEDRPGRRTTVAAA